MDPNACLQRFLSALGNNEAWDAHLDLEVWLSRRGFEPDWSLDPAGKFKSYKRLSKYTSVGCYPLIYARPNGHEHVCAACASAEGLDPFAGSVLWEGDPYECDECGDPVETAYGSAEVADERSDEDLSESVE